VSFELTLKAAIILLPVLAMLAVMYSFDTHRLVGSHVLTGSIAAGCGIAVISYFINNTAINLLNLDLVEYSRHGAPLIEELLKAGFMVLLFRTNRVGFVVDAAILGFSVGAGFALVENLYYFYSIPDAQYGTWIVRGFGTAIMHGGTVAVFSIAAQRVTDRHEKMNPLYYLPGLFVAVLMHILFNYFPVAPVPTTVVTLLILSVLFLLLFERGSADIHNFLTVDFAAHEKLLRQIDHGELSGCEAGRFLTDLEETLATPVVDDMIRYLRLHTELILNMESVLLEREDGKKVQIDDATKQKLAEMHQVEKRIGKVALHTIQPHLHFSRQELWEIHLLDEETHVGKSRNKS
jgi:RsiW-degrading membrane proteinase PrsW (M82 family)